MTVRGQFFSGLVLAWIAVATPAFALDASVPAPVSVAIATDPAPDTAHPARMIVLHVPSHGVLINGLVYSPAGAGTHPTLVICHGLPGNEKNLDLAQAARRAGWNAVTFNYRGSWGSAGKFSFAHVLEDVPAVLAYLRDPTNAAKLGIDPRRIVLAGHSMGGWATLLTASRDHDLIGAIVFSAADMGGGAAAKSRDKEIAMMADDMETLQGVTAQTMADEMIAHAREYSIAVTASGLSKMPLLVLTADDGLAPPVAALVSDIKARGNSEVTQMHVATDHGWSDHRIALQTDVLTWLAQLPP